MRCRGFPPAAGRGGGGCRPRDVIWAPPPAPLPVRTAPNRCSPPPPHTLPLAHPSRPNAGRPRGESWLPPAAASMHPALYTRASMIREIAAAVGFISKFLRTKGLMNERQLQTFSQSLQELLAGEPRRGSQPRTRRGFPPPSPPPRPGLSGPRVAPPSAAGRRTEGVCGKKGKNGPSEGPELPWSLSRDTPPPPSPPVPPAGGGRQERAVNKRGSGVVQPAPPPASSRLRRQSFRSSPDLGSARRAQTARFPEGKMLQSCFF